mgnify:CR=1 FL=1
MNLANKITFSRIVLSIVIMILLLFPFEGFGIELPTYLVNGTIYIELKYIYWLKFHINARKML